MRKKAGWTDQHGYEESIQILVDLALVHAEQSGPYRDVLCDILHRRDWAALLDFELGYDVGSDAVHLIHARQALAFFQKFEPLKLSGVSKTLEAFRKFVQTEVSCQLVNQRFCNYRMGTPLMGAPFDSIMHVAREKIRRILGDAPELADLHFRFGPGA
jgi:hypothetical protein